MISTITIEIELPVKFTPVKGYPQVGPSFGNAGEPGVPDSIEDLRFDEAEAIRLVNEDIARQRSIIDAILLDEATQAAAEAMLP